jgi:hypothetical protein
LKLGIDCENIQSPFCSCAATRGTVELSNKMAEAGANAVLVVNPSYYKNRMTVSGPEFIKSTFVRGPEAIKLCRTPSVKKNLGYEVSFFILISYNKRLPFVGEISANFFEDRACHVVIVTDPYGRNLGFLDRSRYFFFQVAPQLYSRG